MVLPCCCPQMAALILQIHDSPLKGHLQGSCNSRAREAAAPALELLLGCRSWSWIPWACCGREPVAGAAQLLFPSASFLQWVEGVPGIVNRNIPPFYQSKGKSRCLEGREELKVSHSKGEIYNWPTVIS